MIFEACLVELAGTFGRIDSTKQVVVVSYMAIQGTLQELVNVIHEQVFTAAGVNLRINWNRPNIGHA